MNVKGYKLDTGEVVIGDLISEDGTIELKNAVQLVIHDAGEGRVGIGMQPFIPFTKDTIVLNSILIQASFVPDEQIVREYDKLFGSGLVLPDNKLILH